MQPVGEPQARRGRNDSGHQPTIDPEAGGARDRGSRDHRVPLRPIENLRNGISRIVENRNPGQHRPPMPNDGPNLVSVLPSDATVTSSSGSNQIVGSKSTPPPAVSSPPSGSPVVYEEVVEPLFVLVTCNGFLFSDRYC